MYQRTRLSRKIVLGGKIYANKVYQGTESFEAKEDACIDYVGKVKRKSLRLLPDSDCDINHRYRNLPVFSSTGGYFELYGVRPEKTTVPSYDGYPARGSAQRTSENSYYVSKLLAITNPFRPEFSIPVSMVEMLDISSLFKVAARSFAELAGSSYLQYRFGIVQFAQDIKTLSSITKAIESRVKELSSLSQQGGLRRNVKLDVFRFADVTKKKTIWSTYGHTVYADVFNARSVTIRGSVRWRWKQGVTISLTKLEAFNEAVKAIFDLGELDASTLWNMIPWTWLVDYFTDVNSWLQANENSSWVEPYDICIIRKVKTRNDYRNFVCSAGFCEGGYISARLTSRDANLTPSILPASRFSLISMSQFQVILALLGKFHGSKY